MFEKVPLSDFRDEFESYMGCWKTLVFAGIAIDEGQQLQPVAVQIWASDNDQEQTSIFRFPDLPSDVCMFKATRWLASAWPIMFSILDRKCINFGELEVSFAAFKFQRSGFLTSLEFTPQYPKELHDYVSNWPRLLLIGTFENQDRLLNEYGQRISEEFRTAKYLHPSLEDAASQLIGIQASTLSQWGLLYAVLKIPIELTADFEGRRLTYKLTLPTRLEDLPKQLRCLVATKSGEKYETVILPESKHQRSGIEYSSHLDLAPNEQAKEVILHLRDKRVASARVSLPTENVTIDLARAEVLDESIRKKVFVIHGRNEELRKSIFVFLRAIGLNPVEWTQAIAATKKASPYVGEVLAVAFNLAQAIVVLSSGDDEAKLLSKFVRDNDPDYEKELTPQPRPNVLFEAGMAMGRDQNRTVLVQVGKVRPWSDIAGRHITYLDNSPQKRHELAMKLQTAGCALDLTGQDWMTVGDFGGYKASPDKQKKTENSLVAETPLMAYCVKCHLKREIRNAQLVRTRSGRRAVTGTCPVCGTKLFRLGLR